MQAYFSLDDIIATEQKLTYLLNSNISPQFFDPAAFSYVTGETSSGGKIELPCWLAQRLFNGSAGTIVSTELPMAYKPAFREILDADAVVVDLHKLGPYFYNFGRHLLTFDIGHADTIVQTLVKTFLARVGWLMDVAQNSRNEQRPTQLDKLECELYEMGKENQQNYLDWLNDRSSKIQPTKYVISRKKRKRNEI